jgi:hypothetical protein
MNLTTYINVAYVWDGIILWAALALAAMAFNRGASERLNDGEEPVGREA